jgi:TetR/AcrR family transcriptional regulator, mexJK operon transcriptional repressor
MTQDGEAAVSEGLHASAEDVGRATPEARRAHAKREQIRAAARDLFLATGYERTTMDAIAAAARVSKQTLYRYYPAKEALFVDILRALTLGRFLQEVPTLTSEASPIDRAQLEGALLAFAAGASEHVLAPEYVALLRVLIAEAPRFPEVADQLRATLVGQGSAALERLLVRAHRAGIVAQPPTEEVLLLFIAPLLAHLLADGLISGAPIPPRPSPDSLAALVRLFLRALD